MIPDVPRAPSDPMLRAQVEELYETIASMRDYLEYQLNVTEDRLNAIDNRLEELEQEVEENG